MSMTNNPTQSVDEVVEEFKSGVYCGVAPDDWTDQNVLGYKKAQEEILPWLRNILTTLQTQHEKELREERERIKQWSIKELAPIQEQLQTERYSEVREYLIGQRNKLFDLQQALTDNK